MNYIDFFSGIGCFALGAYWAGMKFENHYFSEIDPYCIELYQKRFPDAIPLGDITKLDVKQLPKGKYVITGGFPCPAFSKAGKQGGFEQDSLFYDMLRIIDELQPKMVISENVEGFIQWRTPFINALKDIGYITSDAIIDARDFGIPQARRRYFAVSFPRRVLFNSQHIWGFQRKRNQNIQELCTNIKNTERWWTPTIKTKKEWRDIFINSGRMRKTDRSSYRMDRFKGIGNTIIPQIAELLFVKTKNILEKEL